MEISTKSYLSSRNFFNGCYKNMHICCPYPLTSLRSSLVVRHGTCKAQKKVQTVKTLEITTQPLQQEVRDFHPNVWRDNHIQSLKSPFLGKVYAQRTEDLVTEIRNILPKTFKDSGEHNDIIIRVSIVDWLLSLGIDRYFQEEIKQALDYVYRYWNMGKGGVGYGSASAKPQLNSTALAFRLLRLHRYPNISPSVFERFRSFKGSFGLQRDNEITIRTTLNLLRASYIQFPGEIILQDSEFYASHFLKAWLSDLWTSPKAYSPSLVNEVKYALEYPWFVSSPRWEARSFITLFSENNAWLKKDMNVKLLELAILDFNIIQAQQQEEMKHISRWWNDSDVSKLIMYRQRPIESYCFAAIGVFEQEFSTARLGVAKAVNLGYLLDDLYDSYATIDELPILTKSIQKLDGSLVDFMPHYKKTCIKFILQNIYSLAHECSIHQNYDIHDYIRDSFWRVGKGFQQDATWNAWKHVPNLEEYMINGTQGGGVWPVFLIGKILMSKNFSISLLERRGLGMSKMEDNCGRMGRLLDDIADTLDEKEHGECATAVECYMQENQTCTREEATSILKKVMREMMREVTEMYLHHEISLEVGDPLPCLRIVFELTRAMFFYYIFVDGFTICDTNLMDQIRLLLFEQVPSFEQK